MLRSLKCGNVTRANYCRGLSTVTAPKDETFEAEWKNAKPYSEIPGPSTFELIRSFFPGGKYHNIPFQQIQIKVRDEYGQLAKFKGNFGRRDIVFAFDPKDFEKVYRTEGIWPARKGIDTFAYYRHKVRPDVFKNMGGLISEQGQAWATMRSQVNPVMLQPKTVKSYIPQVDEVAREFLAQVTAERDANNELSASFGNDLNKWALESIGVIALEQRLGVLAGTDPDAQLLIQSVRDFFQLSYDLEVLPSVWQYVRTPKFNKLMKTFDNMTDLILKHINRGIEELKKKKNDPNAVREASVLEKLLKIDRHVAVVMAMDMLLAGIDTTSATSIGLLYHLAKNPVKQEKLRQEIRGILPTVDSELTPESLNTIPYLRACLKEAARLSPIIIGGIRGAGQDLVLKGYQIPKGIDVSMANVILQQDEAHFPQTTKFIPERWLKIESATNGCPSARTANPFIYLPFGFGPRACIGKRFAELEIEILISRIISQYHLEWNYPPIKYLNSLIMTPTGDLKFKLTELQK